ncbi:hypothetical protein AOXY_G30607 [Acipenser oxyrinchus oxyrinchus]|uniref:Nuclear Testis protein N-terminal domain-containing protein n=1 Tax=Acipenser oxyrinchus oxyrinchus TaxID=40147 RepID=A0AAD8CJZ5_ACIOX|nr:hypothetical protein AOXY_G30607 [Acipenser oxyrinchus oxyrinchus]
MTSPPNFNGIRALLKPPFLNSNSNTPSQANSPFRWYLTRPPWQQSSPAARHQRVSVPLLQPPAPASAPGLAAELRFEPPSPGYSRGVFENFRKWQQYKELAKQHYHSSPDLEALSCFFIPVLRSLCLMKPQLSTAQQASRAVQEWSRLSNFDRMIYYDMAAKSAAFISLYQPLLLSAASISLYQTLLLSLLHKTS